MLKLNISNEQQILIVHQNMDLVGHIIKPSNHLSSHTGFTRIDQPNSYSDEFFNIAVYF